MEEKYFLEVYPDYDINTLPYWIREDIKSVKVTGKKMKTLVAKDGKKYSMENKLNHLSGAEWVYFTNSVINTAYTTKGKDDCGYKYRKIHPTPKPPTLMKDIIEFFTKENEIVLDYFMGVGGSLLGASMCERKAVGIDLNYEYINAYKKASEYMNYDLQDTICGNSLEVLSNRDFVEKYKNNISLILIDPPYGNMMSKKKTGEDIKKHGKSETPFTDSNLDLGNMDKENFLESLKESVLIAQELLKEGRYIAIFIKDMQPDGKELNLLHYDIISKINEISNIYYHGMKIWADQTTKLFPYGYPYSYVSTQIHQYILFFRKEKVR